MTFAMTTAKVIGVSEKSKKDTIYQASINIDLNAKKAAGRLPDSNGGLIDGWLDKIE